MHITNADKSYNAYHKMLTNTGREGRTMHIEDADKHGLLRPYSAYHKMLHMGC